jgi:hypothetical protein
MASKDQLTYLYCIAPKSAAALKRTPRGLPKADKVRAVELTEALVLIVASVPKDEYSSAKIEAGLQDLTWVSACAVGHERVVEHYAKKSAVIPMKLFTLFSSDDRAVKDVGKRKRIIEKTMKRIEGREEWGVRVFFDEIRAAKLLSKSSNGHAKEPSGTSFLMRKKGERDVKRLLEANTANHASELFDALVLASDDSRRRPVPATIGGPRVVLDAAFLVGRKEAKKFQSTVAKRTEELDELGYEVKITGPWPPYNFTTEEA